jgi:hypothetical protein
VIVPAETMARFGFSVSLAFAQDLRTAGEILLKDNATLEAFLTSEGHLVATGDRWRAEKLAIVLADLRLHPGGAERQTFPHWDVIMPETTAGQALYLVQAAATGARSHSSTGFAVADNDGNTVNCIFSMGQIFGTGHMDDRGFLIADTNTPMSFTEALIVDATSDEPRSGITLSEDVPQAARKALFEAIARDADPFAAISHDGVRPSGWSCRAGLRASGQQCDVSAPALGYALVVNRDLDR